MKKEGGIDKELDKELIFTVGQSVTLCARSWTGYHIQFSKDISHAKCFPISKVREQTFNSSHCTKLVRSTLTIQTTDLGFKIILCQPCAFLKRFLLSFGFSFFQKLKKTQLEGISRFHLYFCQFTAMMKLHSRKTC